MASLYLNLSLIFLLFFPQASYLLLIPNYIVTTYKARVNTNSVVVIMILIMFFVIVDHVSKFALNNYIRHLFGFSESIRQYDKFSTFLTLLAPPLYIYYHGVYRTLLGATYLIYTLTNPMFASVLALILASLTFAISAINPYFCLSGIILGIIAVTIFTPQISNLVLNSEFGIDLYQGVNNSWQHRIDMWKLSLSYIHENFYFGIGLGKSRYVPDLNSLGEQIIQVHPHNGFIQLWLESGLLGAILFCGMWLVIYRWVNKMAVPKMRTMSSFIVIYLSFFAFSFSMYAIWYLSSILLGLTWIYILVYNCPYPEKPEEREI